MDGEHRRDKTAAPEAAGHLPQHQKQQHRAGGVKEHIDQMMRPGRHHLVNVFLHAASAMLLFLVLRRMNGGLWRSAFVAAVFAVHPLRAESAAWASERKDVLSGVFFMLTLWAYWGMKRENPNNHG